jgi:APA family basic amino acid/polyamine antiporter
VIILRIKDPSRQRVFSTPIWPVVASGAILGCLYLFSSLPTKTQLYFLYAHLIGVAVYVLFGMRNSVLAREAEAQI